MSEHMIFVLNCEAPELKLLKCNAPKASHMNDNVILELTSVILKIMNSLFQEKNKESFKNS